MPVSADKGVGKVLVADWLDVLDVDDLAEGTRVDDLFDGRIVRRIPEDCRVG